MNMATIYEFNLVFSLQQVRAVLRALSDLPLDEVEMAAVREVMEKLAGVAERWQRLS